MKKLLATLLVSTMALSAFGGLAACGGDDDGAGKQSDFYLVGESAGSLFAGTPVEGWKPIGNKKTDEETQETTLDGAASRKELPSKLFFKTTSQKDVYKITVSLYKNDSWCICDAKAGEAAATDEGGSLSGWDNQIKFFKSDTPHGTEDDYMKMGNADYGDERNFVVAQGGKYEITYNAKGGDYEEGWVTWKRVGDPDKIVMPEKDIYIKGNVAVLEQTNWEHNFADKYRFTYDATKEEYTYNLVVSDADVTAGSEFGLVRYEKGATTGGGDWMATGFLGEEGDANEKLGTSGNFKALNAGTYKLVVKFTEAWSINIYEVNA